jgi:hypothetical protein
MQSGRPAGAGIVPPENFRFVERHRDRIGRAQVAARNASRRARSADTDGGFNEQTEADTSGAAETGIAESSDTGTGSNPLAEQNQPPQPDTARNVAEPPREVPRDTTSDSVSVNRTD